jgi:hypothetical protein
LSFFLTIFWLAIDTCRSELGSDHFSVRAGRYSGGRVRLIRVHAAGVAAARMAPWPDREPAVSLGDDHAQENWKLSIPGSGPAFTTVAI